MARPAAADTDTRQRLLQAGLQLARERGVRALTVRAVASQARANLGSFVHHFGTREAFVGELIERWYAPVFRQLQLTAEGEEDALLALQAVLLQLVAWLVDNRAFVAQLVMDASAGEVAAQRFVRSIDTRHPALLLRLIVQAQDRGQLQRDEPLHQLMFLMTTLAAPVLVTHLLDQRGVAPQALVQMIASFATDMPRIRTRLAWALRGLAP